MYAVKYPTPYCQSNLFRFLFGIDFLFVVIYASNMRWKHVTDSSKMIVVHKVNLGDAPFLLQILPVSQITLNRIQNFLQNGSMDLVKLVAETTLCMAPSDNLQCRKEHALETIKINQLEEKLSTHLTTRM